ncbi:MAG: hypothetical protein ABSC15_11445, partial [Terriglobales bacterium]
MSLAQETPATPVRPPVRRNGRWSAFSHLVTVRMKELKREPEVVFWVFGFPLLLALGLGIAFRNKPADVTFVAIVESSGAQDALSLIDRSPQKSSIHAELLDKPAALKGFRLGKYDLVIESDGKGGFQYLYDPARPE